MCCFLKSPSLILENYIPIWNMSAEGELVVNPLCCASEFTDACIIQRATYSEKKGGCYDLRAGLWDEPSLIVKHSHVSPSASVLYEISCHLRIDSVIKVISTMKPLACALLHTQPDALMMHDLCSSMRKAVHHSWKVVLFFFD